MLETYQKLGGKILFRTKAENINIEDYEVRGVSVSDGRGGEQRDIEADAVIITQDARAAVDSLFDTMMDAPWVNTMRHEAVTEQNIFIGLGVKADLSRLPYCCVYPLEKPFEYAGCKWAAPRLQNHVD